MASYEEFEPENDVKRMRIWTAMIHESEEYDGIPTLYVLTKEEFHYFIFNDEQDQVDAAYLCERSGDADNVTAARATSIPLDNIVRIQWLPGKKWLYIQYDHDEKKRWKCIHCTEELGRVLFRNLRTRLRSSMRMREEPQTVLGALSLPFSMLLVLWFLVMLIWMGAKSAHEPQKETGNTPVVRTKGARAVEGAKSIGRHLGETTTLAIGGAITLGILGWGMFAVVNRPMQKVLVPRRAGERVEKEERDDADEEEKTQEASVRPRSGKITPGKRGKKTRRNKGKKARMLGIVGLVLGVAALALGWLSSIQLLMLVVALIGLGVGITGVLATREDYGQSQALPVAGTAVNILAGVVIVAVMFLSPGKSTDEKGDSSGSATAGIGAGIGENNQGPSSATENKQRPNSATTPPENTSGAGMSAWGEPQDLDGDCKIAVQGSALTIDVPGTVHGLTDGVGKGNAPRVLREVEGDFSIQVKVCGTLHPQLNKGNAPGPGIPFHAGGLLLWDDSGHYVRFVHSGQDQKGNFRSVVAFTIHESGKVTAGGTTPIPEQDVFLKMERRGNDVFGAYSLDGQQWTTLPSLHGVFPTRVTVGVMALNNTRQPMSVRFEGLRIGR